VSDCAVARIGVPPQRSELIQSVPEDEQEALKWYRKAAAQNDKPHAPKLLADLEHRLGLR